jgi:hypothetical protein
MHPRTPTALVALGLALVPLALAARPGSAPRQRTGQEDLPEWPGSRSRERSDDLVEELQGCWRLKSIEAAELPPGRPQEVGYLLVSGRFLSIEVHGGWRGAGLTPAREGRGLAVTGSVSTGIHRLDIDEWRTLTTSTLIGTRNGFNMQVEFERPETERRFEFEVEGERLAMKREDGAILRFEKMPDSGGRVDFWGRPVKEEKEEEKDAREGEEPR